MTLRREQIQREEPAMRLVVRKLEVLDVGQLQSLVMEHLDGIEPGLTVVDSRLLLGHATVDIVALDVQGTLVLVSTGFTADEEMLLKAVEAYSWCLEYPDAIRRLYPSVDVSAARPPRLMFVVERLPDAFQRKIKQLGFSEVDCVEFRHLDVSGTPAAYFDTVARLRRGSAQAEFQPAPIARRVSEGPTRRTPEMASAERPVDHGDKVVPLSSAPGARATSVRLQKMLNTTVPHHANGVAPVIEIGARSTASMPRPDVARVETPRFEAAHVELAEPDVELASPQIDAVPVEQIDAVPVEQIDAVPVETAVAAEAIETAQTPEPEVELTVETMPTLDLEELTAETVPTDVVTDEPVAVVPDAEPSVVEPVARIALREAIAVPEPVAGAPAAADTSEPRLSFAEIAKEL